MHKHNSINYVYTVHCERLMTYVFQRKYLKMIKKNLTVIDTEVIDAPFTNEYHFRSVKFVYRLLSFERGYQRTGEGFECAPGNPPSKTDRRRDNSCKTHYSTRHYSCLQYILILLYKQVPL